MADPWEAVYTRGLAPDALSGINSKRRLRFVVLAALRRDFADRCCYCTGSTIEKGGEENFDVEHFRPQSVREFAHLAYDYRNLYYACRGCNLAKGKRPVSEDDARRFIDPCEEPIYPKYLRIGEAGEVLAGADPGGYLLEVLKLRERPAVRMFLRFREFSIRLRSAIQEGDLSEAQKLVDLIDESMSGEDPR